MSFLSPLVCEKALDGSGRNESDADAPSESATSAHIDYSFLECRQLHYPPPESRTFDSARTDTCTGLYIPETEQPSYSTVSRGAIDVTGNPSKTLFPTLLVASDTRCVPPSSMSNEAQPGTSSDNIVTTLASSKTKAACSLSSFSETNDKKQTRIVRNCKGLLRKGIISLRHILFLAFALNFLLCVLIDIGIASLPCATPSFALAQSLWEPSFPISLKQEKNAFTSSAPLTDVSPLRGADEFLVVLQDGSLHAISADGEVRWSNPGIPLRIRTTVEKLGENQLSRRLVAGGDGRIFYQGEDDVLMPLPITVRDIVFHSPFSTPLFPDVYFLGKREAIVESLDFDTGGSSSRGNKSEKADADNKRTTTNESIFTEGIDRKDLRIGQTRWVVRAMDLQTHIEQWRLEWREVTPIINLGASSPTGSQETTRRTKQSRQTSSEPPPNVAVEPSSVARIEAPIVIQEMHVQQALTSQLLSADSPRPLVGVDDSVLVKGDDFQSEITVAVYGRELFVSHVPLIDSSHAGNKAATEPKGVPSSSEKSFKFQFPSNVVGVYSIEPSNLDGHDYLTLVLLMKSSTSSDTTGSLVTSPIYEDSRWKSHFHPKSEVSTTSINTDQTARHPFHPLQPLKKKAKALFHRLQLLDEVVTKPVSRHLTHTKRLSENSNHHGSKMALTENICPLKTLLTSLGPSCPFDQNKLQQNFCDNQACYSEPSATRTTWLSEHLLKLGIIICSRVADGSSIAFLCVITVAVFGWGVGEGWSLRLFSQQRPVTPTAGCYGGEEIVSLGLLKRLSEPEMLFPRVHQSSTEGFGLGDADVSSVCSRLNSSQSLNAKGSKGHALVRFRTFSSLSEVSKRRPNEHVLFRNRTHSSLFEDSTISANAGWGGQDRRALTDLHSYVRRRRLAPTRGGLRRSSTCSLSSESVTVPFSGGNAKGRCLEVECHVGNNSASTDTGKDSLESALPSPAVGDSGQVKEENFEEIFSHIAKSPFFKYVGDETDSSGETTYSPSPVSSPKKQARISFANETRSDSEVPSKKTTTASIRRRRLHSEHVSSKNSIFWARRRLFLDLSVMENINLDSTKQKFVQLSKTQKFQFSLTTFLRHCRVRDVDIDVFVQSLSSSSFLQNRFLQTIFFQKTEQSEGQLPGESERSSLPYPCRQFPSKIWNLFSALESPEKLFKAKNPTAGTMSSESSPSLNANSRKRQRTGGKSPRFDRASSEKMPVHHTSFGNISRLEPAEVSLSADGYHLDNGHDSASSDGVVPPPLVGSDPVLVKSEPRDSTCITSKITSMVPRDLAQSLKHLVNVTFSSGGRAINNLSSEVLISRIESVTLPPPPANNNNSQVSPAFSQKPSVHDESRTIGPVSNIPKVSILANFVDNGRFCRTFKDIQIIGKGGFGSVFRAKHRFEPDHPEYAIKLVSLHLKASENMANRRYFREVSANRDLFSRQVVRYFTWWCEEPQFLPHMAHDNPVSSEALPVMDEQKALVIGSKGTRSNIPVSKQEWTPKRTKRFASDTLDFKSRRASLIAKAKDKVRPVLRPSRLGTAKQNQKLAPQLPRLEVPKKTDWVPFSDISSAGSGEGELLSMSSMQINQKSSFELARSTSTQSLLTIRKRSDSSCTGVCSVTNEAGHSSPPAPFKLTSGNCKSQTETPHPSLNILNDDEEDFIVFAESCQVHDQCHSPPNFQKDNNPDNDAALGLTWPKRPSSKNLSSRRQRFRRRVSASCRTLPSKSSTMTKSFRKSHVSKGVDIGCSTTRQQQQQQQQLGGVRLPTKDQREPTLPVILLIQMELVSGVTLRQWLDRPQRTTQPHVIVEAVQAFLNSSAASSQSPPVELTLFRQLIKGLREIHTHGIVHRDIKPENIFIHQDPIRLKIGDFGLARFIQAKSMSSARTTDTASATTTAKIDSLVKNSDDTKRGGLDSVVSVKGLVIGTPGYTAPEGGALCTEKADIYAAALILLELLSPRFETSMERFKTLENFRSQQKIPDHIYSHLKPLGDLMKKMGSVNPKERPSADTVYKSIKGKLQPPVVSTNSDNDMKPVVYLPVIEDEPFDSSETEKGSQF